MVKTGMVGWRGSPSRLKTFYAWTRRRRDTHLVVLDREEHEAAGVLLQQRLVGLDLRHGRGGLGSLSGLLNDLVGGRVGGLERRGRVLLARGLEVELLNGRVTHLEVLEGGSSLKTQASQSES